MQRQENRKLLRTGFQSSLQIQIVIIACADKILILWAFFLYPSVSLDFLVESEVHKVWVEGREQLKGFDKTEVQSSNGFDFKLRHLLWVFQGTTLPSGSSWWSNAT